MVHNGIEYAMMQLISETYDLLHRGLGLGNDELNKIYKNWNDGDLQSFLIEITRDIFLKADDKTGNRLVDMVLDKAGAKGTGKWTSQDAMDLGVPIPVIDMAVNMREISAYKDERTQAAALYKTPSTEIPVPKEVFIQQVRTPCTLVSSSVTPRAWPCCRSHPRNWTWTYRSRTWSRSGVVAVSSGLPSRGLFQIFRKNPALANLLLDGDIAQLLQGKKQNMRNVIIHAIHMGYPVAGLMAALGYFDAYRSERMPTNLIQAQRDYFGAHTYQRTDEPGTFHSEWNK